MGKVYTVLTISQIIADMVTRLGERGIYTILDCHQDLFSPKFCGKQPYTAHGHTHMHSVIHHTPSYTHTHCAHMHVIHVYTFTGTSTS